jgi:NADH-quinone oxidoreductase subunit N
MNMPPLMPAAPEIFLAILSMLLLIFGVFRGDKSARTVSWLAVLALIVCGIILTSVQDGRMVTFGGQFVVDDFAHFMKWLVLIGSALAIVMAIRFNEQAGIAKFEFPVLIVFASIGMLMMVSANDLISLYIGLELQSLSLYVVASFRRDSRRSSEAGLKYFVLGALSSGMLLYGASLIYGFAGTTSFDGLATLFKGLGGEGPSVGLVVGLVFVISGLAFKVSAVPFHMWVPDVYQGAPTPVTAFFAVAPKIAAIALFVRVLMGPFGVMIGDWQQVVIVLSIASMALGAFAAIRQTNIKRLMAYSSIGHVGYALIGLAAGTEAGVRGVLVYMAIYLVMNVGTFCCILAMRRTGRMVEGIDDLAGLARTHPLVAMAMAAMMFSMAGIPPLAGFFGKFYIFVAAIDAGLITLAVIGVLTSVVGAFYYLRIIKIMYFEEPVDAFDGKLPGEVRTILVAATLFVMFFFLRPGLIIDGAAVAAQTLIGG